MTTEQKEKIDKLRYDPYDEDGISALNAPHNKRYTNRTILRAPRGGVVRVEDYHDNAGELSRPPRWKEELRLAKYPNIDKKKLRMYTLIP